MFHASLHVKPTAAGCILVAEFFLVTGFYASESNCGMALHACVVNLPSSVSNFPKLKRGQGQESTLLPFPLKKFQNQNFFTASLKFILLPNTPSYSAPETCIDAPVCAGRKPVCGEEKDILPLLATEACGVAGDTLPKSVRLSTGDLYGQHGLSTMAGFVWVQERNP